MAGIYNEATGLDTNEKISLKGGFAFGNQRALPTRYKPTARIRYSSGREG